MRFKLLILLVLAFVPAFFIAKDKVKILSNEQNYISETNLSGNYTPTKNKADFHNLLYPVPEKLEPLKDENILGSKSKSKTKRIEVDLAKQKLYAYEGSKKVMSYLVSTGLWGKTPTGEFEVWTKLNYTLMTGGSKTLGTYYYLPNVPYVMFFYNKDVPKYKGFGIHGTYWHNNFGRPMSHGCINMKTEEVAKLFAWAPNGIKIKIFGTAPNY